MKNARDIGDVMKSPVISVEAIMDVIDALQVAKDHNIHHLAVVERGELRGIVCTCDLRDASLNSPVEHIMHRDVATVVASCSIHEAAELMVRRGVGSVVVTHGKQAVGIATRLDISEHDEAITDLMSQCKCAACGSLQHLRIGNDGEYLCVSCLDRASPDGWFDLGAGD